MPRPSMYGEKMVTIPIHVTEAVKNRIDEMAGESGCSRGMIVSSATIMADKESLISFTIKEKALRKELLEEKKRNKELSDAINKDQGDLFKSIEISKEIEEFCQIFIKKYHKWYHNGIKDKDLSDLYDEWLYKNKKMVVKDKRTTMQILKSRLSILFKKLERSRMKQF